MKRTMVRDLQSLRSLLMVLLTLLLLGRVLGHATLVLGTISTTPNPPQPGESFTLSLELEDPTRIPIEDAVVLGEFTALGLNIESEGEPTFEKRGETITVRLSETTIAGTYEGELVLSEAGLYELQLRDQTYRQEEARAQLSFTVGGEEKLENISFVFPPTATGARTLRTWLYWLIGLPIVAAVVVTVLVVMNHRPNEQKDPT
ncbi:MAG: hypothetical protein JSV66_03270 [Trueperaceae bacterium]|nr:MAG: hypothetical protein JSV66_03270 [Trueperaceae bacterium]